MTTAREAPYVQRFSVSFEYPVHFTRDVFDPANPVFSQTLARREPGRLHRVFAVIDHGVALAWPDLATKIAEYAKPHGLELAAEALVVPGGEAVKNDDKAYLDLLARFHALGLDRQSFVAIIGGGAVLDMAGYAAAIAHRGIRVVRLPTTTLAQCDGGVGVKTGVNAFGAKNFIGTFTPPFAVINDLAFLDTLARRDRTAGFAEVVKVGLIKDGAFFEWIEANAGGLASFDAGAVAFALRRAAQLHLEHIAGGGDAFELGSARPLDYGHWSAHKLESMSAYRVRHGEAVAIGMCLDAAYAHLTGRLTPLDLERIIGSIESLGLPFWDDILDGRDPHGRPWVLRGLEEFREHLGGALTITLLEGIGAARDTGEIEEAKMVAALAWLAERARR